jgi:hypothetical protein
MERDWATFSAPIPWFDLATNQWIYGVNYRALKSQITSIIIYEIQNLSAVFNINLVSTIDNIADIALQISIYVKSNIPRSKVSRKYRLFILHIEIKFVYFCHQ